jgi:antitoxin YefM
MITTYQINTNELTSEFIEILKATYKDKQIEISVYDIDETEYLLRSPKNKEVILNRIADLRNGVESVTPNQEIFQ